jgi:hypothetical protein
MLGNILKYSGKRLEVTSSLGEDLSDTSHPGDLTFSLIFLDSCIPQPVVVTGIYRVKLKVEIDKDFVFFVGTFFRRNSNKI